MVLGRSFAWRDTGTFTDPTDLGAKLGFWYDLTDNSVLWQNTGGTTAVTATSDPVRRYTDKSSNGNDASTLGTATPGNGVRTSTGVDLNNSAFQFAQATSGLTDDMRLFAVLEDGSVDTQWVMAGVNGNGSVFAGVAQDGNTSAAEGGMGTLTYYNDGATISTPNRQILFDAWGDGTPNVAEVAGLTVDVFGTAFQAMSYATAATRTDIVLRQIVLTTNDLTAGELSDLRAWAQAENV